MLVKPYHVAPIREGRKTQTRRLWKTPHVRVGGVYAIKTRMLARPGEDGHHGFVRVLARRQERLGDISPADARAESYPSVLAFAEAWRRINGHWNSRAPVWVVVFRFVGDVRP